MTHLTPCKLVNYVIDYDYEITVDKAKEILEILKNDLGTFTNTDIIQATDYIVMGIRSRYVDYFN